MPQTQEEQVEHTSSTSLVAADGTLIPTAVGWSRHPVHTTDNLPTGWWYAYRTKKWEYWGITSSEVALGLTIADLDFGTVLQLYLFDRSTGEAITTEVPTVPPNRDLVSLPGSLPPLTARGNAGDTEIEFEDAKEGNKTRLRARTERVLVDLEVDTSGESLSVVVPWSSARYQYTVKSPGLPVTGTVTIDGRSIELSDAWATLDRGRGRWPYVMSWNWGTASGLNAEKRRIGLTLGARWTDGTGTTENALVVDGRMASGPLPDVEWTYDLKNPERAWHIEGPWINATITPWHVRKAQAQKVVMSSYTTQVFGEWTGWAMWGQEKVDLDGLVGWAEDAANRW